MNKHQSIRITTFNDDLERSVVLNENKAKRVSVECGKITLSIIQEENGLGLIVDATDSLTKEQDLGSMTVWYDHIEELLLEKIKN